MSTDPRTPADEPLIIDMWMDIVCPFCLLGDAQLQAALEAEGMAEDVQIRVHAYELDPDAPSAPETNLEHLAQKYGTSPEQALANETRLQGAAAELGLDYETERPVANTLSVHRAVRAASRQGQGAALFRALQRGYFAGRLDPFDTETQVREAARIGLDADVLRAAIADASTEEAVRADEAAAQQLGASGVPFTVIAGALAVPGAVGVEDFRRALVQAREIGAAGE
ncbi:DsbA family oxidoreductase [Brachybacterium sp. JHP9]|uniref:DsbA family oxidoreductase n=1 Tax=Brachybacterium equifaecis TaxID=2910770 RepID=A0ABT0R329_9MICO|nr:DsbA family oxidoreductase [Brachybacterium equifaecis]MCL6423873.1 DsbA family oxidoreductase [Brachybacterium equifaecis]